MTQNIKYVIEDELHAESQGEYDSYGHALAELKKRSEIPWNKEPNLAPCTSWLTCGRNYEIIEYDATNTPWEERKRTPALKIFSKEVKWLVNAS